jgi:haloacid dehalogenase, type II|nr:haloacid dehalogenase type II [uncultured Alistipes sp.]
MENLIKFKKPKVLFFDINETILDLTLLKVEINNLLGQDVFDLWFTRLLHQSLVFTITERFESFTQIAIRTLKQVSAIKEINLTDDMLVKFSDKLSLLPPYPDVVNSLEIFKQKEYIIVALSNSSKSLLERQLKNAKIDHFFNKQISVELFSKYKPHKQVYHECTKLLSTKAEDCMLIAAHDWDIFGALCSGLRAAFVKRAGKDTYFFSIEPELKVDNLFSLAHKL